MSARSQILNEVALNLPVVPGAELRSMPLVSRDTISIIIPMYNERAYVGQILERVRSAPLPANFSREIIIVDDGSTDGTTTLLENLNGDRTLKVHHSVLNFGKGTAIRVGLHYATGDIVLVQDGDLEYDPSEYTKLLQPLVDGKADVVYGSRFLGHLSGMRWQNYLANRILTFLANVLYGANITDEATGYKAFRREALLKAGLKCKRFEFCPEVTAKVRKLGFRIAEVPITYEGRTAQQGKKIKFSDGLQAIWTLILYRFTA
jgi:dolichol-phosphate mannosyltransferase